jgi:predicted Zn-dependent protease
LNNNFGELVKKYEKYTSERRQKKLVALLGLLAVIGAGFLFISKSEFIVNSFKKTTPETKIVTPVVETKKEEVIKKKEFKQPETKTPKRVKVDTPKSENLPNKIYKRDTKKIEKSNPFQLEVKERKNLYSLLTKEKKQNSYQSAINIASFYFEEKDYDKAISWAVKASKKNPKQSRPWIIYAKSKASLGKTKVAQKALSIYLKHTNSKEVQNLLNNLK